MVSFKRKPIKGIFPLIPFCLKENQEVDYEGIRSNIEWLEEQGIPGFIQFGCMGQMNAPSEEEFNKVCDVSVDASKKIACMVSSTATSTKEVIRRAKYAEDAGADGSMLALPYAFPVTDKWAVEFYKEVDEALKGELAIMVYNYPPLTGFNITPSLWKEHLLKIDSIKALKEANMAIPHHDETLITVADKVNFFSVAESFFWKDSMLGGNGIIGILTWVAPKVFLKYYDECRKGNQLEPWTLRVYKAIVRAFGVMMAMPECPMESYEHGYLNALVEIGRCKAGPPRRPYGRLSEACRKALEETVRPLKEIEESL